MSDQKVQQDDDVFSSNRQNFSKGVRTPNVSGKELANEILESKIKLLVRRLKTGCQVIELNSLKLADFVNWINNLVFLNSAKIL